MKLSELEPEFVQWTGEQSWKAVDSLAAATGLWFLCPKCFRENGGIIGTHMVICWDPTVPQTVLPGPGRWAMTGTGLDDLTLSPSVNLSGPGCGWHGFVKDGEVTG